ncbi:MAG: hypothetical protein ACI9XZ_004339, partial [Alphaproteobacteria bacterium]
HRAFSDADTTNANGPKATQAIGHLLKRQSPNKKTHWSVAK